MLRLWPAPTNLLCIKWRNSRVRGDSRVMLSNQNSVFHNLIFLQERFERLVLQQCFETSCKFLLPVLLYLNEHFFRFPEASAHETFKLLFPQALKSFVRIESISLFFNRPFAASHSRGTKPPCRRAKVALGQDKQRKLPFKIMYVFSLSCPMRLLLSSVAVLYYVNG